jgi:hypothetical protein
MLQEFYKVQGMWRSYIERKKKGAFINVERRRFIEISHY